MTQLTDTKILKNVAEDIDKLIGDDGADTLEKKALRDIHCDVLEVKNLVQKKDKLLIYLLNHSIEAIDKLKENDKRMFDEVRDIIGSFR